VDHDQLLTDRFESNRVHLRAVAYRILGNVDDADDAVQEAWLRLASTNTDEIDNLPGWLTTVVSRICLNRLRSRQRQLTESMISSPPREDPTERSATPEEQAVLADSLGQALLIVLEMLTPAERICFVLHDTFDVPFDDIAQIVDKSSVACRQLASRARRRVRTGDDPNNDPLRQREVVNAFLIAAKTGNFEVLVSLLSHDVELTADKAAVAMGAPGHRHGAHDVASMFSGRAKGARVALLDGLAGLVWSPGETPRVAFDFTIGHGTVTRIEMIADPEVLAEILIEPLGNDHEQ